jgi:hypothetical protein
MPLEVSPTSYFSAVACNPMAHNVLTLEGTGRHYVVPLKPLRLLDRYLHLPQSSSRPSPGPFLSGLLPLYWPREVTTMSPYNRNWIATPDEQLTDTALSVHLFKSSLISVVDKCFWDTHRVFELWCAYFISLFKRNIYWYAVFLLLHSYK